MVFSLKHPHLVGSLSYAKQFHQYSNLLTDLLMHGVFNKYATYKTALIDKL